MTEMLKQRRTRIGALTFAIAGLFGLAVMRLIALVVLEGPRLTSMARSEQNTELELAAVRGNIFDRNGTALALSAETRSVYAHPKKLLEASSAAERAHLAAILSLTPAELERRLARPSPFVWLRRRIDPAAASAAEALGLEGVGALSEYKRFYPESTLAGPVIGAAGMDGQGLSGVELEYDKLIRGEPVALTFYHDAFGHPILDSPLALKSPEPGAQIELTIDSRIQALAERELGDEVRASGARRGTAIVLDPFSGEILALANVGAVPDPIHDRLRNPAVQDAFEPGSTMKGLLASIALTDRAISPAERIYCENGEFHLDRRTIHDDSRHQWLDLAGIIEVSSNIGAAKIALRLGAQRFYQGLRAFGIGRRTGIDLPGEATGLLRKPSTWREIDLANHGFGQGIAVTPIQLAIAYAAIANGGMVLRPYVVKSTRDAEGHPLLTHTPQIVDRAIAPAVAHRMNLLLRNVVSGADGTAHRAQVDGYIVAGKTGTAQMVDPVSHRYFQNRHVSSFVGFVPADDPRLLILVVLYDVGHAHFGGLVAAPVFSEIASGALRDLDVASNAPSFDVASIFPASSNDSREDRERGHVSERLPTSHAKPAVVPSPDDDAGFAAANTTPDFSGASLRRAFEIARKIGANLEVKGDGYVIAQEPAPGTSIPRSPIRLALGPARAKTETAIQPHRAEVRPAPHRRRRGL